MFSDIYGSSSMLTDLRRNSVASVSSTSSNSSSSASFAAASRLEEATDEDDNAATGNVTVGSLAAATRQRRARSLSLYGPTPRLASTLASDEEVQAVLPSTGRTSGGAAGTASKLDPAKMSTAGALMAGPTMQFLLSGGNPASLIPASARRAFRFRRVHSRSRIASANYTPMSAGGPLSLTRLFAALVLLCTVGVLVAPIPAGAIRPHSKSYTAHRPMDTHHQYSNRDQIIEAGHLIPHHYSAGMFNGRFGSPHAHAQQALAQRRAAAAAATRRDSHAAVLARLVASKRGYEAVHFEYDPRDDSSTFDLAPASPSLPDHAVASEHRPHTGRDLLDISHGMAALIAETAFNSTASDSSYKPVSDVLLKERTLEKIKQLAAEGHNRHRYRGYSHHQLHQQHEQEQQQQQQQQHPRASPSAPAINSADLSPFARPPPSLAAADLFDPQNVFSQPAPSPMASMLMMESAAAPAAAAVDMFELGLANHDYAHGMHGDSGKLDAFDAGFAGLRGHSFRSHMRALV